MLRTLAQVVWVLICTVGNLIHEGTAGILILKLLSEGTSDW